MNWYYAREGRQVGPLSEQDLQAQVATGVVGADTLVWHEGMAAWQPYGTVTGEPAAGPSISPPTCSQCGRAAAPDDMLRFGDRWVCASCKPVFVQGLKEGAITPEQLRYGGFWIRFGAWAIDVIILSVIRFVLYLPILMTMFGAQSQNPSMAMIGAQMLVNLFDFAIRCGYQTFFVGKFGATPGKMVCGLKIVMPDGGRFGYPRALARFFAKIISYLTLCIGFIMAGFDDEKRALHDRICDTRVVRS
jgi:uncharacterized RDD family membrane protein YckC